VLLQISINMAQAALGAEVKVPTLDGEATLTIPPGTQPGQVFRLPGKGIPHLRRNGRGDQIVVVDVEIPTRLNAHQRALLEQLADSLGTEVKPQERSFLDKLKDLLG
jgi:molecular chaperone DnaJ